jgi:hypothetical protein
MYGQENSRINAIPLKEVTERLRNFIENKTFSSGIDKKLFIENHSSRSSTIYFYGQQHPDIYRVYGEQSKEKAKQIRNQLLQIFTKINSFKGVNDSIQELERLGLDFEASRRKLDSLLRQVSSKTELNIVFQCSYLKPGLE